jgi:hypothetical protein
MVPVMLSVRTEHPYRLPKKPKAYLPYLIRTARIASMEE